MALKDLDRLNQKNPEVGHRLMKNIVFETASRLSIANQTIGTLL